MNYQKIEKFSIITILTISIILFLFSFKYGLGFLLGGISSLLAFKWLQRLEYVAMDDYRTLKRALTKNKLIRYLIYAFALLMSFLRPEVFSFITCFIGILVVRVWIIVIEGREV